MDRAVNDLMEDGQKTGWFHCGRCGSFFGAEVGGGVPESCPECGRDPVVSSSEMAFVQATENSGAESSLSPRKEGRSEVNRSDGGKKRKKERSGLMVFVGIWLVILVDGFSNSPAFNIRNQLDGWSINSQFDCVLLFDLKGEKVYDLLSVSTS